MKFVCEKCRTKYSIADEKVRRKVLKIRCKNCANIIVVREPKERTGVRSEPSARRETSRGKNALDAAFAGAFGSAPKPRPRAREASSSRPHGALAAAADFDSAIEELEEENTVLDARPEIPVSVAAAPGAGTGPMPMDDEWYLAVDGNQFGPMAFTELCSRVKRGEARSETGDEVFVWRDGFDDWLEVHNVPELRPYVPPPPPPRGRSGLFAVTDAGASGIRQLPQPQTPPPQPPPPPAQPPSASQQFSAAVAPAPSVAPSAASAPDIFSQLPPERQRDVVEAAARESGIRQLPGSYSGQVVAPPLVATQPEPTKTPLSIKIAAVGGIISTLTGVAILVYFFAFDRPQQQQQQHTPPQPPERIASHQSAPPTPAPPPESEEEPLRFQAMEISRSKADEKEVHASARSARRPKRSSPRASAKDREDEKEQKRLLALYKKTSSNGAAGTSVPDKSTTTRRRQTPRRRLGSNDVTKVQRENARAMKACYERALKRDPTLSSARVEAQLNITDSGTVRRVTFNGSDSADLRTCLERNIRRWIFPSVGAQTISFPLIFRGS